MRKPKYMSPSSLKTFEANREEYYLKYLAEAKPPRIGQTQPMSVGSAFDAFVKSYLHNALFGHYGDYEARPLFEKQVEQHNWDWAWTAGQVAFTAYKKSGALIDLMTELNKSVAKPRFEIEVQDFVSGRAGSVPLLGKPDILFINEEGARVILDWKVNGYCSRSAKSPEKGFVKVRDGWSPDDRKYSANNMQPHRDCFPSLYKGILINPGISMEEVNEEWAAQLSTYAWLLGEDVGSMNLILGIEQLACQPGPFIRVASHRCRASSDFQFTLLDRYVAAWQIIGSGHIFDSLSRQESDALCADLEAQATSLSDGSALSDFVNQTARRF